MILITKFSTIKDDLLTPLVVGRAPSAMLDFTKFGTQSVVAQAPLVRDPVIWPMRTEVTFKPLVASI
jgi:hypothetical protein